MKGIQTAIILLVTIAIFSVAASAQDQNGYQNKAGSSAVGSKSESAGPSTSTLAGSVDRSKNGRKVKADRAGDTSKEGGSSEPGGSNYEYGVPAPNGETFDRYGYQGMPLSSNSRPCLVSGARRCVQ